MKLLASPLFASSVLDPQKNWRSLRNCFSLGYEALEEISSRSLRVIGAFTVFVFVAAFVRES